MKALIWKEFRENLKWAALPALLILGPVVLFGGLDEPPSGLELAPFHILAAVFGAVLGFLQVFFESGGDKRSLLLHRPISHSQIFLGKVVAGVGLYLLAVGIPFAALVLWCVTPGHVHAPFTAGMLLPWTADLFTGLVYYFAGMLTAQREARWYGSRGLGLAMAFLCTFLVWILPEFWQAMLTIVVLGTVVGVAAWGSFLTGGACAPQPRLAKAALAATLLTGLLFLSAIAKYNIGGWFEPELTSSHILDRQGRVLYFSWKTGAGPVGSPTDLDGRVPPDFEGKRVDRNTIEEIEAPLAGMDWPMFRSYRGKPRYSIEFFSESQPGNEHWYYVPSEGRLLGYDEVYKAYLGSFGPEGFVPAWGTATGRFEGNLRYTGRHWDGTVGEYLAFPGGVYTIDFSRRKIRTLFTPPRARPSPGHASGGTAETGGPWWW